MDKPKEISPTKSSAKRRGRKSQLRKGEKLPKKSGVETVGKIKRPLLKKRTSTKEEISEEEIEKGYEYIPVSGLGEEPRKGEKITKEEKRILQEQMKRFESPTSKEETEDPSKKAREIFVGKELKKLKKPTYKSAAAEKDPTYQAVKDIMTRPRTFIKPPDYSEPGRTLFQVKKSKVPKKPKIPKTIQELFTLKDKKAISNLLKTKGPNIEIEASLGTYRQGEKGLIFSPGFKSYTYFKNIKDALEQLKNQKGSGIQVQKENTRIETMRKILIRRIVDLDTDSISFQRKIRHRNNILDYPSIGVRIARSEEQIVDLEALNIALESENIEEFNPDTIRVKRRTTYKNTRTDSKFYGLKFDLTHVEETYISERGEMTSFTKYEVEIERVLSKDISVDTFVEAITHIYMFSQDKKEIKNVMNLIERRYAVKLHNNLFWNDPHYKRFTKNPYVLYGGYWNKPKNIKLRNLADPRGNWDVTVKLNGVRRFMLIGDSNTYLYGSNRDVFKIGSGDEEFSGTFIDGEYIKIGNVKTFYAFDILFYQGRDLRQENFKNRMEKLEQAFEKIKSLNFDTKIILKEYFKKGNLYTKIKDAFQKIKEIEKKGEDLTDGLIFQPPHWYKNNNTLKWKPPSKLTIDFLLKRVTTDEELEYIRDKHNLTDEEIANDVYLILVGDRGTMKLFTGTNRYPHKGFILYQEKLFKGEPLENRIIECSWSSKNEEFIPVRIREDRDKPNNYSTAASVWDDIMNPITKKTIKGNSLKLVRKFHNKVKLTLLQQEFRKGGKDITGKVFGDVILDIGSGRGGDITKWNAAGLRRVYALEPNEENLEELERRKEELYKNKSQITDIVPLNFGAEDTEQIKMHIQDKLDGIVSFFSLTFFPKSEKYFNSMLDTISLLPPGGKFIGIVMDGERTENLLMKEKERVLEEIQEEIEKGEATKEDLKEAKESGAIYSNPSFEIEQTSKFTKKPYGNKIEITIQDEGSMVKNQEEFLFYFDNFRNKLKSRNFNYREKMFRISSERGLSASDFIDRGGEYEALPKDSKTFSSLMRVFVFTKQKVTIKPFDIQKPQEGKLKNLPNPYNRSLCIRGGPSSPSNIIYSVLYATSANFRKSVKKLGKTEKFRVETLPKRITEEMYDEFTLGPSKKLPFEAYKQKLKDSSKWLADFTILELLMKILKMNIYVLVGKQGKVGKAGYEKIVSIHPSAVFATNCEIYDYDKSIVLYTSDNLHYSLVAECSGKKELKEEKLVFSESNAQDKKFINEIYSQICSIFD